MWAIQLELAIDGVWHGRSSRKKAESPNKDAFIATNEDELRKRVEEAEAQLREEAKIIERMTRDNKSKQEQLNAMEALLQREADKHAESLRLLEDEHATLRQQAEHDLEVLRARARQLELHVEAYDVLEGANAALRERVDKLVQELELERRMHAEEIHKVRLDMFNHKMALEKTFRKALQELDAEYLKKAFNAMSEESKNALIANAKLKDELQLQSIGVDNLMQRFTQQAKHFLEMKVANEILQHESRLHLDEVASMKKQQLSATRAIQKLKENAGREQLEWKEHANRVIEELRQENLHLQRANELAQKRCTKWKSRCLDMTEEESSRRSQQAMQRAQTAPATYESTSIPRAESQPALGGYFNFDEMWSASMAVGRVGNQQLGIFADLRVESSSTLDTASGRLASSSSADLPVVRPSSSSEIQRRKPHRVPSSILPRRGQAVSFNFS